MGDIAQRGNRLTFAKGGKGEWIEPIKTKAKKDTESVRDVRAKGGRAGHALGHTAGRRLTETLERLGGGPEGKPHSTRAGRIAAGVRKIKRGAKSWNKKDFKGSDEVRALLKGLRPKKPSTHGKDIPTMAAQGGRAGFFGGGITKISKILKQTFKPRGRKPGVLDKVIGKGVVDKNVKSKELKKLLEKSKARSKERVAESKLKKKWLKGK